MNLVLIGMPGCGKSTIGSILSKEMDMKFYDADEYIEAKNNMRIPDIFKNGEDVFRNLEIEALKELSLKDNVVIATGGGAVVREKNMINLKKTGKIIFINRPPEKIIGDINIDGRPLLKEGKNKIFKLYDERYNLYTKYADYSVLNESTIDEVVLNIKKYVKEIQ